MINLEVRFTPTSDWQQNSNVSNQQNPMNGMGQNNGLGQNNGMGQMGGPQSSAMQDNPIMALFMQLIMSMLQQMMQQANGDNGMGGMGMPNGGGGAPSNPFTQPGSSNRAMEGLGNNAMKDAIRPTANGGGQLSEASQPLQKHVGKMMDSNPGAFGTPGAPQSNSAAGGLKENNILHPIQAGPQSNPAAGADGLKENKILHPIEAGSPSSGSSSSSGVDRTMFPKASSDAVVINEPIVVKAGETFDGKGKTFTASSKLGDGGQSEDQQPLFKLEPGATLKNVVLGDNEADGIHTFGDAKLDNVHWTDVGEDALTMKKGGRVEISNSSARNADDKIFQLNDPGTLVLNNVQADNFGKLVRTNGGEQGDWDIQLNDVKATNGKHALVRSDSTTVNVSAHNVQTENVKGMYKLPSSATLNTD